MERIQVNEEELNSFYSSIGKAIWHIQVLEDGLNTYTTMKNDLVLSKEFQERIDKFPIERDWLVHRSFIENQDDLYARPRLYTLIDRVGSISKEALALQEFIKKELEEYLASN